MSETRRYAIGKPRMRRALIAQLVEWLEEGEIVYDANSDPVPGPDNKPKRRATSIETCRIAAQVLGRDESRQYAKRKQREKKARTKAPEGARAPVAQPSAEVLAERIKAASNGARTRVDE